MKIFKNPNRNNNSNSNINVEPYVPEHIRLNKEPVEPILLQKTREQFRRAAPKHIVVPPQVKVNSGQNQEWMQVTAGQHDPTNPASAKVPSNIQNTSGSKPGVQIDRTYVVENSYYDEPLASQAVRDFSSKNLENIKDEDVDVPQNLYEHVEENINSEELDNSSLNFSNLNIGEFVLIYDNDVIATGNEEDISNLLENILISEGYNVIEEKLVILKKMNFRTGVLISD